MVVSGGLGLVPSLNLVAQPAANLSQKVCCVDCGHGNRYHNGMGYEIAFESTDSTDIGVILPGS